MTAEFIYNGQSSKDFNLRILNDVTHELSTHDIIAEPVPGRDGVLLIDNERLNPVERAFPLRLEDEVYPKTTEIAEWLGAKGWYDLELSWDEGFVYQATNITSISIDETFKQLGKTLVVFLVHPIKYFKYNQEWSVTSGRSIRNNGNVKAHPRIELSGNGNTVLTINGRRTVLEDIQGSIVLDMKRQMVYSGNLSAWDKVIREEDSKWPYLEPGDNTISWTGDFAMTMIKNEGVRI